MTRLLIHVEGETEETFVNEILAPHLFHCGYSMVSARLVGNARQRSRRGGIRGWSSVRKDIIRHLKEDRGCFATTMVDYYGLPQAGAKAWPGRKDASQLSTEQKANAVQIALHSDVVSKAKNTINPERFFPYVMMHEFEGLLFSDCKRFGEGINRPDLVEEFEKIRNEFTTPEEINDSPITAPSKRVERLVPGYTKPLLGVLAVLEIGLDSIRNECPQFRVWLERLEKWPQL